MWDKDEMVVFWFDADIPFEDRKELLNTLQSQDVAVEDQLSGGSGLEPTEIDAYIVLAKSTLSVARFVASKIINWRKHARETGKSTAIRIERPGRAPISLNLATDEEVMIFITDGREPDK